MKKPKAPLGQGTKLTALPQKKDRSVWSDYFAQMDSTERILLAFTANRQPRDQTINEFYGYSSESFRFLDHNLPGPDYSDVASMLKKWKKVGFLVVGRYPNSYSFVDAVAEVYWQWINEQATPEIVGFEPTQAYTADLPETMDNILAFLVMADQGEVLLTRTKEVNKHSVKRILAALTEPSRPEKLFTAEHYFFWLLGLVQFFEWIWEKGDHLLLTEQGRDLPVNIRVEELLCQFFPVHLRSCQNKGYLLVLPLLDRCTKWTSWSNLLENLITDNVGNLYRRDRIIGLLNPLRFLGLIDWGEYKEDIFIRTTPLGQLLFPKILRKQKLEEYIGEIKNLIDQVYPLDGPNTAYVQPNFEILVPRSASWTVRWELGHFAVLEQQDQMLKYRLDKTYLMNALKRGMPAGDVINLLTELSPYPLPENLVLTIEQWVESYGQVTFMQLSLLECTTPEQAASIASARKYKEYVLGLYSPTAVIVREPEKLRKLLEKQGIYPLPGILDGEGAAKRQGLQAKGLSADP